MKDKFPSPTPSLSVRSSFLAIFASVLLVGLSSAFLPAPGIGEDKSPEDASTQLLGPKSEKKVGFGTAVHNLFAPLGGIHLKPYSRSK